MAKVHFDVVFETKALQGKLSRMREAFSGDNLASTMADVADDLVTQEIRREILKQGLIKSGRMYREQYVEVYRSSIASAEIRAGPHPTEVPYSGYVNWVASNPPRLFLENAVSNVVKEYFERVFAELWKKGLKA